MTRPAYEDTLYDWARTVAATFDTPAPTPPAETPLAHTVEVIWADEDAPRPKKPPYVSLRVLSSRALGRAERTTRPDADAQSGVSASIVQRRQGQLEVQVYGLRNDAIMSALEMSIRDDEAMGALRSEGVVIEMHGPRLRLGLASARVIEERAVTEFTFRYIDRADLTVPGAVAEVATTLQLITRTPAPVQPGGPAPIIQPPPTDTPDGDPFDFTITVPAPEEP